MKMVPKQEVMVDIVEWTTEVASSQDFFTLDIMVPVHESYTPEKQIT